jgi:haloacid dehalogenase superfamily, subfamily IA, variant 3 with third motif having DD or ED/haloacid dehalogenase superfamily, subfamily IA, variant 1 with third motif having Dx(3-4)D or Dx(3-4)E
MALQAVIFDLGGTLVDWPDWNEDIQRRWALSYDYLVAHAGERSWPDCATYVRSMQAAEASHWQRVTTLLTSNRPEEVLSEGFAGLQCPVESSEIALALEGYGQAVMGWATVFPDAAATLQALRSHGLRLGLLSNTWWAGAWHDADLVTHGLASLFDTVVYTSDLAYSKPHPDVFYAVTRQLAVEPAECVMVGDRLDADVVGGQGVGMRAVWKKMNSPWSPPGSALSDLSTVTPDATITNLEELLPLCARWSS